jgi:hypothetical protein
MSSLDPNVGHVDRRTSHVLLELMVSLTILSPDLSMGITKGVLTR